MPVTYLTSAATLPGRAAFLHRAPLATLSLVLAIATLLLAPAAASSATLAQRIDANVRASGLSSSTSVVAWGHGNQRLVYTRNADRGVAPASLMKLYTTAAAMRALGPHRRFATRIALHGRQEGSTWIGSVYLVGGGDPTLSTSSVASRRFGGDAANIGILAYPLKLRGIRKITGRVFVDDSYFDRQRYVSEWPSRYRYDESAPLGALVVNQARTAGGTGSFSHSPDLHAGWVYHSLLERNGIDVQGGVLSRTVPDAATYTGVVYSPPLRRIARFMNRYSDNFMAEMLIKNIGRHVAGPGRGTTLTGRFVAKRQLAALGVDVRGLRWIDGSGLSSYNRVTARMTGNLFNAAVRDPKTGPYFWSSLAIAGGPGTLERRSTWWPYRARIRGKTGTLRHSSALAGMSTRWNTKAWFGFVVITDVGPWRTVPYSNARATQDAVARILVR